MRSNYKKLGDYITEIDIRNAEDCQNNLLGVSTRKVFIESIANTVGTDFKSYKIIKRDQFAYVPDTSRRGDKIGMALLDHLDEGLISQAYTVFEITETEKLLPEYLMMWFRRPECDRYSRFHSWGSVREIFDWESLCDVELPIPHPDKQKEIINEYNTIVNRINLNNQLIQKLEETAQAIYKQWFVDFEFPDKNGNPYKSSGGEMEFNEELEKEIPKDWKTGVLSDIANIVMGQSPDGETYNYDKDGMIFYQGRSDFGFRYPSITTYTTSPKRKAKKGDILVSVRAPVGDLNIATNDCCIGRGIAAVSCKLKCNAHLFYLMQKLKSKFNISNDEGTVFGSINKVDLHELKIIYTESKIKLFEKIVSPIETNIKLYSQKNDVLINIKTLLFSKLATIEN